jgi:hypothetical protein
MLDSFLVSVEVEWDGFIPYWDSLVRLLSGRSRVPGRIASFSSTRDGFLVEYCNGKKKEIFKPHTALWMEQPGVWNSKAHAEARKRGQEFVRFLETHIPLVKRSMEAPFAGRSLSSPDLLRVVSV